MDSLTHLLVAAAMAQAGVRVGDSGRQAAGPSGVRATLQRHNISGLALLALSATAPDAEVALSFFDPALYVRLYHGPLHSLAGATLVAVVLALAYKRFFPQPPSPNTHPLMLALAGCGSHLGLDVFHGYGEQLLWPLSSRRFTLPLMAQFDLTVLLILGFFLIGPALLNMVNREIGAPRMRHDRPARAALALVLVLLPVRALLRARAYDTAAGALTEEHESFAVFPSALLLWHWNAVEDTSIAYMVYEVDGWGGQMRPFLVRLRKPMPNNLFAAAREAATARAFLDLASYPLYSLQEGRRGVLVRIRDLAFYSPGGSDRPFSVEVEVTSTMKVLSERAAF